jgi:hypothetical protein
MSSNSNMNNLFSQIDDTLQRIECRTNSIQRTVLRTLDNIELERSPYHHFMELVYLLLPEGNRRFPELVLDKILDELNLQFYGTFEERRQYLREWLGIDISKDYGGGGYEEHDYEEAGYEENDYQEDGFDLDDTEQGDIDLVDSELGGVELVDSDWVDCALDGEHDSTHSEENTAVCIGNTLNCSCIIWDDKCESRNCNCNIWEGTSCPFHKYQGDKSSGHENGQEDYENSPKFCEVDAEYYEVDAEYYEIDDEHSGEDTKCRGDASCEDDAPGCKVKKDTAKAPSGEMPDVIVPDLDAASNEVETQDDPSDVTSRHPDDNGDEEYRCDACSSSTSLEGVARSVGSYWILS